MSRTARAPHSQRRMSRRVRVSSRHWQSALVAVVLSAATLFMVTAVTTGVASGNPTTFAYGVNGSGSVSAIAPATNPIVATFPAGSSAEAIAITPNGAYAYVANVDSNSV